MDKFEEDLPRPGFWARLGNVVVWVGFLLLLTSSCVPYLISYQAYRPLSDPRVDWQQAFERLWADDRCTDALAVLQAANRSRYSKTQRTLDRFFSSEGCGIYADLPGYEGLRDWVDDPYVSRDPPPAETEPEWIDWWKGQTESWLDHSRAVSREMRKHLWQSGQHFDVSDAIKVGIRDMNCDLISRIYSYEIRYYELRRELARVHAGDRERFETWDKSYLLPDWERRYAECGEPALEF